MKKALMTTAVFSMMGVTAFADISTPVSVSLNVVETSDLVLMDGSSHLTQIDLKHPQILLSSAKGMTSPSVVKQNFKVQSGDGNVMKVDSKNVDQLDYTLEGITGDILKLKSGASGELESTLTLASAQELISGATGAPDGIMNTITSTIAADKLNGLTKGGTYTGTTTLKVKVGVKTTNS